jgi:hypothetical protein
LPIFSIRCFQDPCRFFANSDVFFYGSKRLRNILLVKAKKEVHKILQPIKSPWPSSSVIIVSNGWTNAARHPLINFMVSSLNGPVFLKAMNALGKYKDAQYMGEIFIKVIEYVCYPLA